MVVVVVVVVWAVEVSLFFLPFRMCERASHAFVSTEASRSWPFELVKRAQQGQGVGAWLPWASCLGINCRDELEVRSYGRNGIAPKDEPPEGRIPEKPWLLELTCARHHPPHTPQQSSNTQPASQPAHQPASPAMPSRRLRPRQSLHVAATDAPPAPSSPAASLALLHTELQRHIGSFLDAKDATTGVASASCTCRVDFLAGVTCVVIMPTPLQLEPDKSEEEHAASLARLLRLLPSLTHMACPLVQPMLRRLDGSPDVSKSCVLSNASSRIVGLGCRRLESPLANVIILRSFYEHTGQHEPPHPLAYALAEGRFPALKELDNHYLRFLCQPNSARLLEEALTGGHLTQLKRLNLFAGHAIDAVCQGLLHAPPAIQQRQARVRTLWMAIGFNVLAPNHLEDLKEELRLPCFALLEEIKLEMRTDGHICFAFPCSVSRWRTVAFLFIFLLGYSRLCLSTHLHIPSIVFTILFLFCFRTKQDTGAGQLIDFDPSSAFAID
jgi:hypothetical protein